MKKQRGITLIALIITIIVMLILVGVTISVSLKGGLFDKTKETAIMSNLEAVREEINLIKIGNLLNDKETTIEDLVVQGIAKRVVLPSEDDNYNFSYVLIENSLKAMGDYGKGNPETGKDIYIIDSTFNIKYVDKKGNEYGDEVQTQILTDDTKVKFYDENFKNYMAKVAGVSGEELTFKWLKNQTSLIIESGEIEDLTDLVFCPNLTSLTLKTPIQLTSLSGIENCSNLKELISYGAVKQITLEDAKRLSKCSQLSTVIFQALAGQEDFENLIDGIKNQKNLRNLTVSLSNIENIKKLKELNSEEIESLSFNYNKISKIEGIEEFKKIKNLNFESNNISDILQFANISSIDVLQELKLTRNSGINANREEYTENELILINKIGEILNRGRKIRFRYR